MRPEIKDSNPEHKLKEIILWERKSDCGYGGNLEAVIKDNGDLELEGYDGGKIIGDFFGGDDYEYWFNHLV